MKKTHLVILLKEIVHSSGETSVLAAAAQCCPIVSVSSASLLFFCGVILIYIDNHVPPAEFIRGNINLLGPTGPE